MSTGFALPKFGVQYYAEVIQRSEDLISAGIWSGLHPSRLRRWLANFTTEEERYFSACILDALIFRSADQTLAMLRQLFARNLPDLARRDPPPARGPISDWDQLLARTNLADPKIRLVPVIHPNDPPTKSGFLIARDLKRFLKFNEQFITWPKDIPQAIAQGTNVFIFLDDFLGSGDQFSGFATSINLPVHMPAAYFIYAPLVAHTKGIEKLKCLYPSLRLTSSEVLGATSAIFCDESTVFDDGLNDVTKALDFYLDLLDKKGIHLVGDDRRGYSKLELAYTFEHAAPDNCLPILWWHHSTSWTPLFDR